MVAPNSDLISYMFPWQPNIIGSRSCPVRLVNVHVSWLNTHGYKRKKNHLQKEKHIDISYYMIPVEWKQLEASSYI